MEARLDAGAPRQDDQIDSLAKQGKPTLRDAHIVLNAPITKVG